MSDRSTAEMLASGYAQNAKTHTLCMIEYNDRSKNVEAEVYAQLGRQPNFILPCRYWRGISIWPTI